MPPKKRFPLPKNIVEPLRQAMARSGRAEYAIAKRSGVSQSVVNRFAHGERGSISHFDPTPMAIILSLKKSSQLPSQLGSPGTWSQNT